MSTQPRSRFWLGCIGVPDLAGRDPASKIISQVSDLGRKQIRLFLHLMLKPRMEAVYGDCTRARYLKYASRFEGRIRYSLNVAK